jgi:tetratricopeptide (TPR) repeat protein/tRNA A-37 threonylcarbamoyl transferase component Bud32
MTGPTDDRPLLDLMLAHQRRAWRRGARASVETYLARQPGLEADAETVLHLIYNEIVLRTEAGESPRCEEYLHRFPHLAEQLELQFELEGVLLPGPRPRPDGSETTPGVSPSPPSATDRPGIPGYSIVGELGRGGMGVVYRARQERLNRTVALKMILAGEHAPPEAGIRFLGEAEAVARLHHPNIVQVHAFGEHDGRPYLEMEYVAGGSLADRLDGTPWSAREAARLVETLARAIQEVHRLGVVHRDLKPANVLLATDGTPKIADFGLAKWLDVESGLTRTDHVVGSPSYMAPEQAEGKAGAVGPAADVYALGAILYELLTGRPPFRAATALETLEQVKSAEPVSPRRLRPGLPRDLETVCLKCLRKEPARRYDSASDLAEDLRRFGEGEPIRARPVGALEWAWRWCRREPAQAALAAALVAGFLGVATQWWRAERHLRREVDAHRASQVAHAREQEAHAREQEARRRAEARFRLGMEAVDGYSALAREDELQKDPRMEGLRKRLLGSALKFYTELQASLEADPTPQALHDLSKAYVRVGQIQEELGSMHEALAAFRRALATSEALAATQPANLQFRSALASAHFGIGFALRAMGRLGEAMRSFERSLAIEEGLVLDDPTEVQFQKDLAWALHNLGELQVQTGRPDEGVRSHERVLAIREALTRVDPASPSLKSDLAWGLIDLGGALDAAGFPDEALRRAYRAAADLEELARVFPSEVDYRYRLAQCLRIIGTVQHRAGAPEAGRSVERSLAIGEELARDFPNSYSFQRGLAHSALSLSTVRAAAGRPGEALASIRRVEQIVGRFAEIEPYTLLYMARAYAQFSAAALRGEGDLPPADPAECKAYADRAMAALRRAVAAGFANVALLRRDIDLDPLRPRHDFQELMMDLSFPADPFQR